MPPDNPLGTEQDVSFHGFDVGATSPLGSVPGSTTPPPNLSTPAAPPQLSPAQQMSQQLQAADTQHHSALGKAFRSIMGNDVSYQINPQTGKMEQTETPQKPGQFWRGIIAATVLGGATAAKNKAPGFIQGAAEGGEAVIDKAQQQDELKRKQAQDQFKDQLAARSANTEEDLKRAQIHNISVEEDLKRAQIAMHNAHTLHENQIMQREDYSFHKDVADHGKKQLQPFIDADPTLMKFQDIPETQMTDLLKNNPDSQHLLWEPTGTRIVIGADGKPNVEATYSGVDPKGNVKVTTDQIDQWKKAGLDQIYGKATWDVLTKDKELPANTYMAINQKAQELTNKQLIEKKNKFDEEKEQTLIAEAKARTKDLNAQATERLANAAEKKAYDDGWALFVKDGAKAKLTPKQSSAILKVFEGYIKDDIDEIKGMPKNESGQIIDKDRLDSTYQHLEGVKKLMDGVIGIKTEEKPVTVSSTKIDTLLDTIKDFPATDQISAVEKAPISDAEKKEAIKRIGQNNPDAPTPEEAASASSQKKYENLRNGAKVSLTSSELPKSEELDLGTALFTNGKGDYIIRDGDFKKPEWKLVVEGTMALPAQ